MLQASLGESQSDVGVRFLRVAALGSRTSGARGDLVRGCVQMFLARVFRLLRLTRLGPGILLRVAACGALLDSS